MSAMTSSPKVIGAAVTGVLVAVLGLAGCSSPPPAVSDAHPPLYKKWMSRLENASRATSDTCGQSMGACAPKMSELMSDLDELRRDIQASPHPEVFADVVHALDPAKTDYDKFQTRYSCGALGDIEPNCRFLVITIMADLTTIINKVSGHTEPV